MQRHTLEIADMGTLPDPASEIVPAARRHRRPSQTPRFISHTKILTQFIRVSADKWTQRQTLANEYDVHKRSTRIDPLVQQAVSGMNISRFVQPSSSTSRPGFPQEDLNYSLRRFVVADSMQDANVVYTRIAIKQGRTIAGYVPSSPRPRGVVKSEEYFASKMGKDDLEGSRVGSLLPSFQGSLV